ncbi:MAG: HEAT repeat domain-containing protein [Methanomassiliicoccaceae archaeon]|nr:HEAT repeat domain-containing protein [Methanomassiliicoccaceae archaeon]
MSTSRAEYLNRFLDGVDFVASGRKFAISEDRWLIANYDPSFYGIVSKHLINTDERVRADVIKLLAAVKERAALDAVKKIRSSDKENVRIACLGYLTAIGEADTMMPDLFDILEHKSGQEFRSAAMKVRSAGRSEDVPRLRKIYGQVTGEMREEIKKALISVMDRDENLKKNQELILSIPVFPDERKFSAFLDNSITYLDIRYRDSVACRKRIPSGMYSNVCAAVKKMRLRLYNEYDNLQYYEKPVNEAYNELIRLIEWASDDLSGKEIEDGSADHSKLCSKCGNELRSYKDTWMCVDCCIKK